MIAASLFCVVMRVAPGVSMHPLVLTNSLGNEFEL